MRFSRDRTLARGRIALAVGVCAVMGSVTVLGAGAEAGATDVGFPIGAAALSGPMSDAEFFGSWSGASWAVQPKLDYTRDGLASVRDAAKAGDYATAKSALLTYDRNRPESTAGEFTNSKAWPGALELTPDHVWTLGDGEEYLGTFEVGTTAAAKTFDVTATVRGALQRNQADFMLMSRIKNAVTAYIHSRAKGSGKPTLRVTTEDGVAHTIVASHDTHIWAGYPTNLYGAKSLLQVHDQGAGAFTADTRKGYLQFELGEIANVKSATLSLTGYAAQPKQVMLFGVAESFDETTRTWATTRQNTFSWQGDPGGFSWVGPAGSDNEYGIQLPRFFFAGPLANAYRDTGDERYATTLVSLMTDFIQDADGYSSEFGAGSFPDSLSTARRLQNWVAAYEILRKSPSLTASANTLVHKTFYKTGDYLTDAVVGTPNKMQTQKVALLHLAVGFRELAGSAGWRDNALAFLAKQVQETTYPDGGYVEATGSYMRAYAKNYVTIVKLLQGQGVEFAAKEDLRALAHFIKGQTLPNGFGPSYGDGESSDWRPTLLALGDLLDDDELRYVGSGGTAGVRPANTSVLFPDTRVAVSRSGWGPDDDYLRLNVDRGNHAHPDELAVSAHAYGRTLLPDMGTFTYSDDPRSVWLRKSTEAKNTVEIDNTTQNSKANGQITHWLANPRFDRIGAHTDATAGARHARSVLALRKGLWIVSDQLTPTDTAKHRYEQNWHFETDANIAYDTASERTSTRFTDGANITIAQADPGAMTGSVRTGYYSPLMYQVGEAKFVSYEKTLAGATTFDTVLSASFGAADQNLTVTRLAIGTTPASQATALGIRFGDGRTATYFKAWASRTKRAFGSYVFDGKLLYAEGSTTSGFLALTDANTLTHKGIVLVKSPTVIPDLAVEIKGGVVRIDGNRLTPSANSTTAIGIAAPTATEVLLNGKQVPFTRVGDLIYAASVNS